MASTRLFATLLTGLLAVPPGIAAAEPGAGEAAAGRVDEARVQAEADTGEDWLLNAGPALANHHSPLDAINVANVDRLGLAWYVDIPTRDGIAATPIVVDGVAYLSGAFSKVWAVDVRAGEILWHYDPEISFAKSRSVAWAAHVNRGVAVWHGKVLVGTADCRLIALDAASGEVAWEKTVCDSSQGYRINAAPVVGGNRVFVGNGGSESGLHNRGYVSAHDIDTGDEVWRFYTVPSGTPADEKDPLMKKAAATWTGDAWKKFGGGGSVWDSMTYDRDTGLLIFGTAGALPYIHTYRSPQGGDNLFTESIVAVHADTGEYAWHYQTVPGDSWEYNATMNIVLADLDIDGMSRKVAMVAPKNGFFYVLDRRSGALISAAPYTKVNWAGGVDPETGRPVLTGEANYWEHPGEKMLVWPNSWGAHSWNPMAFHPLQDLAYIPTIDLPDEVLYTGGTDYHSRVVWPEIVEGKPHAPSRLLAWDPVKQEARWAVDRELPLNGGVLSTAGGLVFQGTATGRLEAFSAASGVPLWWASTDSAVSAAPVTYQLDGKQYILVGTGGGGGLRMVYPEWAASPDARGPSRLLAYAIDASGVRLPHVSLQQPLPEPPAETGTSEQIERGAKLYTEYGCEYCHGVQARAFAGGSVPDLRYLSAERHTQWNGVVIGGALADKGMPPFDMSSDEAAAIEAWVIHRAREDWQEKRPLR